MLENDDKKVFPQPGFEPATFRLARFSEGVIWLQKQIVLTYQRYADVSKLSGRLSLSIKIKSQYKTLPLAFHAVDPDSISGTCSCGNFF